MTEERRILDVDRLSVVHRARGRRGHPVVAVDDVSLGVGAGEIVGVVGESGSGKTSLAMAVAGLGKISTGKVTVSGIEVGKRLSRSARAEIQVILQDPHGSLDPRQSVRRGLRELRGIHSARTAWVTDEELLAKVGLTADLLDRLPHQMSGGQAQRVSIARALLLRPSLLLADEPTSALDVSVQAQILRLLLELRRTEGLAILFISHDLAVVRAVCDQVHVMLRGQVVEHGVTAEVFDRPAHEYTRRLLAAIPGRQTVNSAEQAHVSDDSIPGDGHRSPTPVL
ncbi:ATP-binding cassette domain-containing protein [Streptosporangium sp. NPDC002544]|uniref:ABC transporter ATP-binding protein n=1 Tax=unclassified Streptosporangium TaxID=2632669 RepID=UPI003318C9FE